MSDIVAGVSSSTPGSARRGREAVVFGGVNRAGEFFDRQGRELSLESPELSPSEAARLVRTAAAVAWDGCGCGGSVECRVEWMSDDALERLRAAGEPDVGPERDVHRRNAAPTWIDAWSADGVRVLFAHGDVTWGDEFL